MLIGHRRLNDGLGEIQNGADCPEIGDMFDTGCDSLADDVESSLLGDLKSTGVSLNLYNQ